MFLHRSGFFCQSKDDTDGGASEEKENVETVAGDEQKSARQQFKSEQWFKDLTSEVSSLRAWKKAREESDSEAEKAAELEKAKAAADFDKALLLKDQEVSEAKERALKAEVKAALVTSGARITDAFVKVAMAEYDGSKYESIEGFAEALKEREDYAPFFTAHDKRPIHPGPGKTPISGQQTISNDQLIAWKKSGDREERQKATKYLTEYFDAHGNFPPGYLRE